MKKIINLFLSAFIFVSLGIVGTYVINPELLIFASENLQLPVARVEDPYQLRIPKLDITTYVEQVGADESGNMAVPTGVYNAGWWKFGAKPGEVGSAVMAGHVDTPEGRLGIFYPIGKLQRGDEVVVIGQRGTKYVFAVTEIETYRTESFPIELVFDQDDGKRLNLITCSGTFDPVKQDYTLRTVVFTELVRVEPNGLRV